METFEVLVTFRDRKGKEKYDASKLPTVPKDSSYESDDTKWTSYLVEKGILKRISKTPSINLEGNIKEVTQSLTKELGDSFLNDVLAEEKANKNRKGVIEHIESLLSESGDD